ncbi:MAG: hypothetical protein ABI839_03525 [Verrucomicrobiota bacterium]
MHVDKNIFFLVVVAVFGIVRALTSAAQKARGKDTPLDDSDEAGPPAVPPRVERKTDEERVREFLEALGQSPTAAPPPPVVPRRDLPPRPLAPVQPPAAMPFPARRRDLPRSGKHKPAFPPPAKSEDYVPTVFAPVSPAPITLAETLSPAEAGNAPLRPAANAPAWIPPEATVRSPDSWRSLLASPGTLRDAVILREIVGPPLALQRPARLSDA